MICGFASPHRPACEVESPQRHGADPDDGHKSSPDVVYCAMSISTGGNSFAIDYSRPAILY
jgi:hypothetical protein